MSKRILSLVLALVMVLGTFGTVFAAETGNEKIDWLVEQGIVTGNESGDLMLDKTIDRASVAKMVVEALDQKAVAAGMQTYKTAFTDVPVNHWSNGNINVVSGLGLMIGNNGKFMPSSTISYAEVVTILVRMLDGEQKNAVWPTTYIAKAHELGILDEVAVANFSFPAVRKDILEMFYNAMVNREVGNYHIVKGIVLENYRVETLNKDEVVIEVIQEVQKAEFAKENRKGDQLSLKITAKVADVENLLGKVADFSINKAGDVVKVTVDETYKYEVGALKAYDDYLTVGTKEYTVVKDERYEQRDDRVFRTYIDNKSYAYSKYATSDKVAKTAEFARVTTKNGKVLFIDGFNFDDIAPVKEVRNDGKTVYIYDDNRDAAEKKLTFDSKTKVVSIKDKVMNVASLEDIQAMDVIHYNEKSNTVFVRLDAEVEGTYEKYVTSKVDDANVVDIYVDGEAYRAGFVEGRSAVFSVDGEEFETLTRGSVSTLLGKVKKEEVVLLLDMNNRVQYVASEVSDPSFLALVVDTIRGEVRFAKADGTREDLVATFDSKITFAGSTRQRNINDLNAGDLVRVNAKDGEIVKLERIEAAADIETKADAVSKITKDYVIIDGERVYLDAKTKIFVDFNDGKMKGIDIATLVDTYKVVDGNEAYVNAKNNVIVFTVLGSKGADVKDVVVKIVEIWDTKDGYILVVEDEDEKQTEHAVSDANARKVQEGDIVKLTITKDDAADVKDVKVLIEADAEVFEVVKYNGYNRVTLKDKAKKELSFLVLNSAAEFGDLGVGEFISISLNADKDIDALEVRDNYDYELGLFEDPVDKTALEAKIAEAVEVDTDLYVDVTAFNTAFATANTVVAKTDATQEEVDAALEALAAAITGLVEKTPETLTATYEVKLNPIVNKYAIAIKLSDVTKNDKVTKITVDNVDYEAGAVVNDMVTVSGSFDAEPTTVVVLVDGQSITATK